MTEIITKKTELERALKEYEETHAKLKMATQELKYMNEKIIEGYKDIIMYNRALIQGMQIYADRHGGPNHDDYDINSCKNEINSYQILINELTEKNDNYTIELNYYNHIMDTIKSSIHNLLTKKRGRSE